MINLLFYSTNTEQEAALECFKLVCYRSSRVMKLVPITKG